MPAAPAAAEVDSKDAVKGSYVGIHSTGAFGDSRMCADPAQASPTSCSRPNCDAVRASAFASAHEPSAVTDLGFEHPSEVQQCVQTRLDGR